MENKINIAEILRRCPSGMELDCTMYENCTFEKLEDVGYTEILVKTPSGRIRLTKEGCFTHSDEYAKCVIFPKGKTTWEGFIPPCKFKDGDIVYFGRYGKEHIAIFKNIKGNYLHIYNYITNTSICLSVGSSNIDNIKGIRFATEEEKEYLFKNFKHQGYKWNAETKTLEKLIVPKFKVGDVVQDKDGYRVEITEVNIDDECYGYISKILNGIGAIDFKDQDEWELVPNKFDVSTLIPFESKVLIRDFESQIWKPAIFGAYIDDYHEQYKYVVVGGSVYQYLIPYEGNEHLLGKNKDCDKFYQTWKE